MSLCGSCALYNKEEYFELCHGSAMSEDCVYTLLDYIDEMEVLIMDFSKFDKKVNAEELKKDIKEAEKNKPNGDYPEVKKGEYEVRFKSIEVKETKDGRPMLSACAQILEGEFEKSCIFMNRVLYGTKNDGNMINSAIGWLESLETDTVIEFEGYQDFADLVLDVAEEVENFEYLIKYDPKTFNSISIKEVYELN